MQQEATSLFQRYLNDPRSLPSLPEIAAGDGYQAQWIGPDGRVRLLYGGDTPLPIGRSDRRLAGTAQPGILVARTVNVNGNPTRVLTASLGPPLGGALQVAQSLAETEHALAILRAILLVVTLAGIGVAVGLGLLVARATLRPVKRLTAAAEHVAATQDLSATIEEEGDDELTRLAHSFNAMLQALDVSRQQQAQLVADAGHELRTPLTSLRTNIEVLMRAQQLPESERAELLSDVRGQLEELTTLVGDVVELARQDEQSAEPIDVRFDIIVERALERAQRRAPSLSFVTTIDEGLVRAQPALLERAVLNVLDNAIKWSPPGGPIEVRLTASPPPPAGDQLPGSFPSYHEAPAHQDQRWWRLEVRDHGPGISPEDRPHVFDRFYRAPTARALPGSGLGLAIVWRVVTTSGGRVWVEAPEGGGTLLHIELPVVEPELTGEVAPPSDGWVAADAASWPPPEGQATPLEAPLDAPVDAPPAPPAPPVPPAAPADGPADPSWDQPASGRHRS